MDRKFAEMDPAVRLNNIGVDVLETGNGKVAWDLFKGALEVKLAMERAGWPSFSSSNSTEVFMKEAAASNIYIQRAQEHLAILDRHNGRLSCLSPPVLVFHGITTTGGHVSRGGPVVGNQHHDPLTPNMTSTRQQTRPLHVVEDDSLALYTPFLYGQPLKLPESRVGTSTRRESAVVIFNLALVDHLQHRQSKQAVALYELAMTLLTGDTVDILGIAIVNNIGVWCHENDDEAGASTCMGHLANFVRSHGVYIGQEEREGLHSNILFLVNPPFCASPAA